MAEAIGVVGSIISVIQIAQTVTTYLNAVKHAPKEKKDLLQEVLMARSVLETFRDTATKSDTEVDEDWIDTLHVLQTPLANFLNDLGRLKSKLESAGASLKFFKSKKVVEIAEMFKWPFQKTELIEQIERVTRYEVLFTLALENNAIALLKALRKDLAALRLDVTEDLCDVKEGVASVKSDTVQLVAAAQRQEASFREAEFLKIINWLSKVHPWAQQNDARKRAHAGTGSWFLTNNIFETWRDGVSWDKNMLPTPTTPSKRLNKHTLWCPGIPGAGKSVMCSIIVDHLVERYRDNDIAIAWVYCNYTEASSQSVENLLAALLAQIITKNGIVSDAVAASFANHHVDLKSTMPQAEELQSLMAVELRKLSGGFIIIDALDESPSQDDRDHLISLLQDIEPSVQILVTSRPNPEIEVTFHRCLRLEILANEKDIELYLNGSIERLRTLRSHLASEEGLRDLLVSRITKSARGMFLMARLHLDAVANLDTRRAVKRTLEDLPQEYTGIYEQAMARIQNQSTAAQKRATQILTWLAYAFGPLTIAALQHALAVEEGDSNIAADAIPNLDLILSWCAGLVTLDRESKLVRLVHYTTQEYLRTVRDKYLPNGHQLIASTCLTYLSFKRLSEPCGGQVILEQRTKAFGLFEYAALYWPGHVISGNLESIMQQRIVDFLDSRNRYCAEEMNLRKFSRGASGRWSSSMWNDPSRDMIRRDPPLHTACVLGLPETVEHYITIKKHKLEKENDFGQTVLQRACETGQAKAVSVLLKHGADFKATVPTFKMGLPSCIHFAANGYHLDTIKVLLEFGLDVNTTDERERHVALHFAAALNTKLTKFLLKKGADPCRLLRRPPGGAAEAGPLSCLHLVTLYSLAHDATGRLERARILIEAGCPINGQTGRGNTGLHHALSMDEEMVRLLMSLGADYHVENWEHVSPLILSCNLGRLRWLAKDDAHLGSLIEEMGSPGRLHEAIWTQDSALAVKMLEAGADPLKRDMFGKSPLTYCVHSGDCDLLKIILGVLDTDKMLGEIGGVLFDQAMVQMTHFDDSRDGHCWPAMVRICRLLLPYRKKYNNDMSFVKTISPIGNYRKTYLMHATEQGRFAQVEFLLDCGADMGAQDRFGETAAHYARDKLDVLKLLVERGTSLSVRDNAGYTVPEIVMEAMNDATKRYIRSLTDPAQTHPRL